MRTHGVLLALVGLCLVVVKAYDSYVGYELLSVAIQSDADAEFVRNLKAAGKDLDFWTVVAPHHNTSVLVSPDQLTTVKNSLAQRGVSFFVLNDDIQGLLDAELREPSTRAVGGNTFHKEYHRYGDINAYLEELSEKFPNLMTLSTLNEPTIEGRDVTLVELKGYGAHTETPNIVYEAGIHAREWISPAATLFFVEKLLTDYTRGDYKAERILDGYNWYIIPSTNPDGYEYSWTTSRMWRKNRRRNSEWCYGVDLNRNFDNFFNVIGTSLDCSSDIFAGEFPFSEPETRNIRDLVDLKSDSLAAYISVHSYSQLLLVPWANETDDSPSSRPRNYVELDRVGQLVTQTLSDYEGKRYVYGTALQTIGYPASGTSKDWALATYPCIYSYTYELRPEWSDPRGFLLGPEEIIPQGKELYESLYTLAAEMREVPVMVGGRCDYS